jgi:GntR family transcriptional regulator
MAVEFSHLRQDLCPSFNLEDLASGSLHAYLTQEFDIIPTTANQDMEAIACPQSQAHSLGIAKGGAVLHIHRTTCDRLGRPFEQVESFYRGDRYVLQAELTSERLQS